MTDGVSESRPGKMVTQHDIARRCGLSQKAVSLALHGDPGLSPATIERVQAVAAEMGYALSQHRDASRLVMRRHGRRIVNRAIALIMPNLFSMMNYYSVITQGILDTLAIEEFVLVIAQLDVHPDTPAVLPSIFHTNELDGVIFYGPLANHLPASGGFGNRPVVSLVRQFPEYSCVTTEDEQGTYQLGQHLLELGHRHVMHLYPPAGTPNQGGRVRGLARAFQEFGLDPAHHLTWRDYWFGPLTPPHHLQIPDLTARQSQPLFRWHEIDAFFADLHAHPEITAILCPNDLFARRVGYLLLQAGYRIPEDISLAGFDDIDPLLGEYGQNILTSVRLPLRELGAQAAQLLVRQVLEGEMQTSTVTLSPELVIRNSTAQPAAHPYGDCPRT